VHPQRVSELALALSRELGEAPEHSGLRWRELQRADALGERGRGVRAELREQERDASVARGVSVGRGRGHQGRIVQTLHNEYKEESFLLVSEA
jgi:hypothetical protein